MRNLPASAPRHTGLRQLSLVLDSVRVRGMSPSERRAVLDRLVDLLLEAGGALVPEHDDDER
jgi:hypothetical protein